MDQAFAQCFVVRNHADFTDNNGQLRPNINGCERIETQIEDEAHEGGQNEWNDLIACECWWQNTDGSKNKPQQQHANVRADDARGIQIANGETQIRNREIVH